MMVWINNQCSNVSVPPGYFGGAKCICQKCNPSLCLECNDPILENESRVAVFVNGMPRTIHRKCNGGRQLTKSLKPWVHSHAGIIKQYDQLLAEVEELKNALSDLIATQAYKEAHGKDKAYELARKSAWFQAKLVIASSEPEGEVDDE